MILMLSFRASLTTQLVFLNLNTGAWWLRTTGTSGYVKNPAIAADAARVYMGTQQHDDQPLVIYDRVTGIVSQSVDTFTDRDAYRCAIGPDGRIAWGTYDAGRIEVYDPVAETITDFGELDPAYTESQWTYQVAWSPDGSYVYGIEGQNPWYLAVVNATTHAATLYFKDDSDIGGLLYIATDDSLCYYRRQKADTSVAWYSLDNETVTLLGGEPETYKAPTFNNLYDFNTSNWSAVHGWDIVLPDPPTNASPTYTIQYRAVGAPAYSEATITGLTTAAIAIRRMIAYDATRILCLGEGYVPVFWYTPGDGSVTEAGFTPYSLYDAVAIGTDWYLSGYATVTAKWDTTADWTLTASATNGADTNPDPITNFAKGKYHYFNCAGSDGKLYVFSRHERDSEGGSIGQYDPATGTIALLRDPFLLWTPRGIVVCGDVIVASGNSIDDPAANGALFVIDPATFTVSDTWEPLGSSATEAGFVIPVSTTDVIGITTSYAYRINVLTGVVGWSVTLPGAAWNGDNYYDRRAEVHGLYIFLLCGLTIYRLTIATGALTVRGQVTAAQAGNIMWFDDVAYLYGTATLYRLDGLS